MAKNLDINFKIIIFARVNNTRYVKQMKKQFVNIAWRWQGSSLKKVSVNTNDIYVEM